MLTDEILLVENISKKYSRNLKRSIINGLIDIFHEITASKRNNLSLRKSEFWALSGVSLKLDRGDAVGLVGENGSGKTTFLRVISGLMKPDSGNVQINGRVVPLIALGAGFKPVLTGRENIFVNLAILGLSTAEINEVYSDIVNFAEIGDAIDAPVQSYSSGMSARLGFSCAVHAKADILLIDEVLSVGDMRFRSKCYRKLAELREKGTSFILVSHNTNAILSMCNKAIYLKKGKTVMTGSPSDVMTKFEEDLCIKPNQQLGNLKLPEKAKDESTGLDFLSISASNQNNEDYFVSGADSEFKIRIKSHSPQQNVILSALIKELAGESETVLHLSSEKEGSIFSFSEGENEVSIKLKDCGLKPGIYTAKIYLHKQPFYMFDAVESFIFKVVSHKNMNQCLFYQRLEWTQA